MYAMLHRQILFPMSMHILSSYVLNISDVRLQYSYVIVNKPQKKQPRHLLFTMQLETCYWKEYNRLDWVQKA